MNLIDFKSCCSNIKISIQFRFKSITSLVIVVVVVVVVVDFDRIIKFGPLLNLDE